MSSELAIIGVQNKLIHVAVFDDPLRKFVYNLRAVDAEPSKGGGDVILHSRVHTRLRFSRLQFDVQYHGC